MLFSLLGLGGASVASILVRYRHAFLVLALASLGMSFYLNYIKVHAHYVSRVIFWLSVIVTSGVLLWSYGYDIL